MASISYKNPQIFPMYKPAGPTSAQFLGQVKRTLKLKKANHAGHFGTLDPFAEGLILVGINGAMKLTEWVHQSCLKSYLATGLLGEQTETGDIEGEVVESRGPDEHSVEEWKRAAKDNFGGSYQQIPPIYSAAKFEGKPLYQWAREGKPIVRPAVERVIHAIDVESIKENKLTFSSTVSTGTYIRVLFEDLAKTCGELGHLEKLIRTQIGNMKVEKSIKLEELDPEGKGLDPRELLDFPSLECSDQDIFDIALGRGIKKEDSIKGSKWAWLVSQDQQLAGLGEYREEKWWPKVNYCSLQ
jgi:tRNA pseudouridine55 synthase